MKKLLIAGIILLGMIGVARADSITPQQFVDNLAQVPVKLQNHIQMEVEKTKEYQKNSWATAKAQLLKLKAKFIKAQ